MTVSPFVPLGEVARWKLVYDMLVTVPVDGVVTYERLGEQLGVDPVADRHLIQMAMRRAAKELEQCDLRCVTALPNTGYRVVKPGEQVGLARGQQKKAGKALVRGHSKVVHVDMNALHPEEQKAFALVAQAFEMQMEFIRRVDVRQRRLEAAVGAVTDNQRRTDEEVAALRARLERIERGGADVDEE